MDRRNSQIPHQADQLHKFHRRYQPINYLHDNPRAESIADGRAIKPGYVPDIPGQHPDVVILAPDEQWIIRADNFASAARNTPFNAWSVRGRVLATVCNAVMTYSRLGEYAFSEGEELA